MTSGKLRIYLGAAPGVGKTYAMLNEGWRGMARGKDVVVAYLETHDRANTAAQVRDLPIVPRAHIEYREQTFEEMDVDAVLERAPAIALVDELAHTNVPGSRNEKRWQDVEELLAAGIDVITTVNVQHLESLNDVVEEITGTKQRETIPDAVVRQADQIELVDMSPEALRRRMAHGNIYKADKVDAALGHYFRVGNLSALRELALLWMADRVDESLQDYRERHGIAKPWETKERVLVAITGAPGGDDLIRRAARMAMRTRGELIGVHVTSTDGLARAEHGASIVARRHLLESVGGRFVEVAGNDIAMALVQVAHAENATQLVLGASRRSRVKEITTGSVVNRLLRSAGGELDVHVISNPEADAPAPRAPLAVRPRLQLAGVHPNRQRAGFTLVVAGLPLLTWLLTQFRSTLGFQNAVLVYLLYVVLVSTVGGIWPALVGSFVGFGLLNWFFAPPIHTFTISNGRDALALVSFVIVAGVVSALVDLAGRRQSDARRAQTEARTLSRMADTVLDDPDPMPKLAEQLVATFGLDGLALLAPIEADATTWFVDATAGANAPTTPDDAERSLTLSDGTVLAWNGGQLHAEDREILVAFATQLVLARHRRSLQRDAAQAETLAQANELRNALLNAVSHDLRTPLASIRAAATSLLDDDVHFDRSTSKELLQTIDDEADRLNSLVANLLDMSRLQAGARVAVRTQLVSVDEVVLSALASLPSEPGRVQLAAPDTLPAIETDPTLLERALANLIANALAFSPPNVPVLVDVAPIGDGIHVRVVDRGPGIPPSERERVFRPFQRLGDHDANALGVGLGLAVAKGFVDACGAELTIEDTPGGGCTMVVALPPVRRLPLIETGK